MDEYRVIVRGREGGVATVELRRLNRDATLPLGPSFGYMLVADESCSGHGAYRRFWDAEVARDENFDLHEAIAGMELVEVLPRREDEDHGGALVRLEVSVPGALDHWSPGATWGTTAYDELHDCVHFDFADPDGSPRSWRRG